MLLLGAGSIGSLEPPVGVPARKIVSTWLSNVDPAKWRRLILDHPGGNVLDQGAALMSGG